MDAQTSSRLRWVADTKLVLGHWYIAALPNGRALADFTAMGAMVQASLGHSRAAWAVIGDHGVEEAVGRPWSLSSLDTPPESWSDFIVASWLAESAVDAVLAAVEPSAEISRVIRRESSIHLVYLDGWLLRLDEIDAEEVLRSFAARVGDVVRWLAGAGVEAPESVANRVTSDVVIDQGEWDELKNRPMGAEFPSRLLDMIRPKPVLTAIR